MGIHVNSGKCTYTIETQLSNKHFWFKKPYHKDNSFLLKNCKNVVNTLYTKQIGLLKKLFMKEIKEMKEVFIKDVIEFTTASNGNVIHAKSGKCAYSIETQLFNKHFWFKKLYHKDNSFLLKNCKNVVNTLYTKQMGLKKTGKAKTKGRKQKKKEGKRTKKKVMKEIKGMKKIFIKH